MSPAAYQAVMILLVILVPGLSFVVWFLFRKKLKKINQHLKQPGAWRKKDDEGGL